MNASAQLFQILAKIRTVEVLACTREEEARNLFTGKGTVSITKESLSILYFEEHGTPSTNDRALHSKFRNSLRWEQYTEDSFLLSHARYGTAVLLGEFYFQNSTWRTKAPHLCGSDSYQGMLSTSLRGVCLRWNVAGPRKNYSVTFEYSF